MPVPVTLPQKQNKKAYATMLILLWVLVMASFALDWQERSTAYVIDNNSPLDIAIAADTATSIAFINIINNVLSNSCLWVADALLVGDGGETSYTIYIRKC